MTALPSPGTELIVLPTLCRALGMAVPDGAAAVRVMFADEDVTPGYRTFAVACHSAFRAYEGHSQHLCEGVPDGTVIVYPATGSPELLRNVLVHESYHLTHLDGLHEDEARAAGCAAYPVAELCGG